MCVQNKKPRYSIQAKCRAIIGCIDAWKEENRRAAETTEES